jgi:hypothetical protein
MNNNSSFLKSRGRINITLNRTRIEIYIIIIISTILKYKNDIIRLLNHELVLVKDTTKADLLIISAYFTDADFIRLIGVVLSYNTINNIDDSNHGNNT